MKLKLPFKKLFFYSIALFVVFFLMIHYSNQLVENNAEGKMFNSVSDVPKREVGMLLGTAKYLRNGRLNYYYKFRIDATVELYMSGKIKYVLVSGDNSRKEYDEPTDILNDLVQRGIPKNRIFLDYAGFRTLDSIVRANKVFGQSKFIVISQRFHNERAIYIAEDKGLDVIGFNAKDVSLRYGFKVRQREKLARVKMILDLIFNVQPKFLGQKVIIPS